MKVRIVTTAIFFEVFLQYIFFYFVLCIHLVPSCNSLLMFASNFSSIFNHHTDVFVYFFIYSLT